MSETITITKAEYDRPRKSELFLDCLSAAGVDNWEWYDEAVQEYNNLLEQKGMGADDE